MKYSQNIDTIKFLIDEFKYRMDYWNQAIFIHKETNEEVKVKKFDLTDKHSTWAINLIVAFGHNTNIDIETKH